jgi:catechol 2,3-dioxygenase-like lactoylglutathione lyase family enzyme
VSTIPLAVEPAVRFHLSLNVADLDRSVAFYRVLFDCEPAKCRPDYAKFELDEPPLVLSLEPTPRGSGGALNHLGFRLNDSAALVAVQERLERAGIRSQREEGVECCYARQTKFWVTDPDRTLWELYVLEEDIDHRGAGQDLDAMLPSEPAPSPAAAPVTWEHRLGTPVPARVPLDDASADEVLLRGSLNMRLPDEDQRRLVREAFRILRPGGRVFVHVLVGERPVSSPKLPGPAASVQEVPAEAAPLRLLEGASFVGLRQLKFGADPCFRADGVGMRELQLEGWKPGAEGSDVVVVYRGPFAQVTDDAGTVYRRGERVSVPAAVAEMLRRGETAGQYTFFKD